MSAKSVNKSSSSKKTTKKVVKKVVIKARRNSLPTTSKPKNTKRAIGKQLAVKKETSKVHTDPVIKGVLPNTKDVIIDTTKPTTQATTLPIFHDLENAEDSNEGVLVFGAVAIGVITVAAIILSIVLQ